MSKTNSDAMTEWGEGLINLKKEAIETKEYCTYIQVLREAQAEFSKLYSELKMEEALQLVESILKQVRLEMTWARNKQKEAKIPF